MIEEEEECKIEGADDVDDDDENGGIEGFDEEGGMGDREDEDEEGSDTDTEDELLETLLLLLSTPPTIPDELIDAGFDVDHQNN